MKPFFATLLVVAVSALGAPAVRADDSAIPSAQFPASRYESLWKQNPFAVATPDAAPDSPDYSLVGIAQSGGVSYVSVVNRKTSEHFLVSTGTPADGLTLTSITRGHTDADTFAVLEKDGQPMTLKLELLPSTSEGVPGETPNGASPPILMPSNPGGMPYRPLIPRFRRPAIHLPPMPGAQLPSSPPK
jgi:hypothetical protein